MPEVEDPKHLPTGNTTTTAEPVRKLPRARRLLAATIGAATIQFVGGCKSNELNTVANLMAPTGRPAQRIDGQQGSAGFQLVSNLMLPPHIPQTGTSGQLGGAGTSGTAAGTSGSAGSAGVPAADMDAGSDDDAGEA
jgi:hypothetical protein